MLSLEMVRQWGSGQMEEEMLYWWRPTIGCGVDVAAIEERRWGRSMGVLGCLWIFCGCRGTMKINAETTAVLGETGMVMTKDDGVRGQRGRPNGSRGDVDNAPERMHERGKMGSMAAAIGEMGCGVDANQRENAKAAINVEVCGGHG